MFQGTPKVYTKQVRLMILKNIPEFPRLKKYNNQHEAGEINVNVPGHAQGVERIRKSAANVSSGAYVMVNLCGDIGHVEYFCKTANRPRRRCPTHVNPRVAWRLQRGDVFAYKTEENKTFIMGNIKN